MNLFQKIFRREPDLCPDELVKPYCKRAKQAVLRGDLGKAIGYLHRAIEIAPHQLELYLQRAQILQYGLDEYSRALHDYRFILRELASDPDHELVAKCKQAMKDMMAQPPSQ